MWRRGVQTLRRCGGSGSGGPAASLPLRSFDLRSLSSGAASAVDSIILRSLKEHYIEVSKMNPPPKVNPPSAYSIVKGALDRDGPVLRRTYKEEEITISVMRLENIMPSGVGDDDGDDSINQLFLHVDVSKPGREESIQFLCGLYPDVVGIHAVRLRPNVSEPAGRSNMAKYQERVFHVWERAMRIDQVDTIATPTSKSDCPQIIEAAYSWFNPEFVSGLCYIAMSLRTKFLVSPQGHQWWSKLLSATSCIGREIGLFETFILQRRSPPFEDPREAGGLTFTNMAGQPTRQCNKKVKTRKWEIGCL
ncbi:hypothetical protein ZIOFF_013148 [Zingiber officinale]|uniref:Uncharacterized protein n=1 Tax=Zingiber officinale TaxID=94328 RepID=A0A8J5LKP2_ZINOF|nr:hypothetical protein ZIOFF_013148 [Zingiber officinale]